VSVGFLSSLFGIKIMPRLPHKLEEVLPLCCLDARHRCELARGYIAYDAWHCVSALHDNKEINQIHGGKHETATFRLLAFHFCK
jgi:uncharacterized membrane protein